MLAREAMAPYRAYRPTVVLKQAIGGGETANWPILVNLYGADLKQLSAYAVQLNEKTNAPAIHRCEGRVNLGNLNSASRWTASARPTSASASAIWRALRLMVSGEDEITSFREERRTLSREDARARGPAQRCRGRRRADRGLTHRQPGPHRQRRAAGTG